MGKTLDLKSTSLKTGGVPKGIDAYQTDHGRNGKMPLIADTPRDGGGMSVGETSGNFDMSTMTNRPNNSGGATGTKSTADAVGDELQTQATESP